MMSVAWRPVFAWSMWSTQCLYHVNSNATSVRAILLYILIMRLASLPVRTFWSSSKRFIGSSILLRR